MSFECNETSFDFAVDDVELSALMDKVETHANSGAPHRARPSAISAAPSHPHARRKHPQSPIVLVDE